MKTYRVLTNSDSGENHISHEAESKEEFLEAVESVIESLQPFGLNHRIAGEVEEV